MLIALAEKSKPDFTNQLSGTLNLQLIIVKNCFDPSTGLASDDRTIDAIIEDIKKQANYSDSVKGFIVDNYPQNVIQAQSLDMALARIGQPVSSALMMESTKTPQNRENRALIRYYRTQNKLILLDETDKVSQICSKIRLIYEKRRSTDRQHKR